MKPLTSEQKQFIYELYQQGTRPSKIIEAFEEEYGRKIANSTVTKFGKNWTPETKEIENRETLENSSVQDIKIETVETEDYRKQNLENIIPIQEDIKLTDLQRYAFYVYKEVSQKSLGLAFEDFRTAYQQGYKGFNLDKMEWIK